MPDGAPAGTSFADAIDLDASSASDREDSPVILWPPSRPSGAPLAKDQYREAPRIESDSPPPLIVASNIRTAPNPLPPHPPPSNNQQQQQPTMTTQQRLRAAINARNGVQTTSVGVQPSPVTPLPTSSSLRASSLARQRAQQRASRPDARPAAEFARANRLPSPTSYLNGKLLHHEILCRLVVEINPQLEWKGRLVHGQHFTAEPDLTGTSNLFWRFRLVAADRSFVGHWESSVANQLQKLAASNKFAISLRYIDPGAISSPPGLLVAGKSYAFLDVQYPRQGKFHLAQIHRLPICPHSELGVEMPSLLPSQLHPYHFRDLTTVFRSLRQGPAVPQISQAAAVAELGTSTAVPHASETNEGWTSYLQAAVDAASSMSSAMGLTAGTSSTSNSAAWLESLIAAQGSNPSAALQVPAAWQTAATLMARPRMPGALPPSVMGQGPDEDDMLFQMAAHSAFDDGGEPLDADMREILSNMADGTFHGTDALATLYGDKGIDVGKLDLFSDQESLKQRGLKTPLHDHQLQGLQWMLKAEHRRVSKRDGESRGLWRTHIDARGRPYYYNFASRKCRRTAPVLPRGGIIADEMGLGKTALTIACSLADRNRVPKGIKPLSGPVDSKPGSQSQPSTSAKPGKDKQSRKKNEDDDDGFDSEEDYTSECEDGEESEESERAKSKKKKPSLKRRLATTDSSDTEEDSDVVMKSKETHRPVTVDGRAVKSESASSSETEDDDEEPVRGSGKRKMAGKDSVKESGDTKRKKGNEGVKTKAEDNVTGKGNKKAETKKKGKTVKKKEDEYNEATLVICPLSVLQNWTGQVDEHCDKKKVRYYTYHGDMAKYIRKRDAFEKILGRYTFVFTTYDTVRQEYKVIQKRREAAEKRAAAEEERLRKEAEGDSAATTPSIEEVEDEKKPMIQRNGNNSVSRATTEESEYKSTATTDEEDVKPKIKGKGKAKGKGKGKAKSTGRDWYDSDDSLFEKEIDELETEDDPREIPLFGVKWRRIVLDEAHICRNPRTHLYSAICELKGERRWAVTGTPIVNSTKDMGALAAWCGLYPFAENPKEWTRVIERPLKKANQSEQAAGLLRKVVTSICLRRNKSMKNPQGEPIVKLPDVKFYKHTIPLTTADRDYYSKCEAACREHLSRWADEGNLQGHQSAILTFLLRLRQMSCHRRLIGSKLLEEIQNKDWDSVDKTEGFTKVLSKKAIEDLQNKLKVHVEMNDDCPICFESLMSQEKVPVITPCGHPFCKECLGAIVGRHMVNTARCPMDRLPLPSMEHMIEMPIQEMTPTADEDEEEESSEKTSAKVRECMKIIRATLKKDPTEKILVFSNFVKFLNIIQEEIKEAEISHARFNGSLDVKRRDAVLKSFCKPINPRQSVNIQKNLARLDEKLQREREAERKAAERKAAEGAVASSDGPAPSEASHTSSSSSLLNSLRTVDRDIKPVVDAKGKGKQRAQDDDVVGENPSVLLISMGCGALGLNLTVASTVLLMDPWWQSSLEQQSLDRTHRIGQKRDVKVFQIIAESTVEARMLEIQATKEGLAETAFSGMRATGSTSDRRTKVETNIKDLVRLFGLSAEETQQLTARSAAVAARRN